MYLDSLGHLNQCIDLGLRWIEAAIVQSLSPPASELIDDAKLLLWKSDACIESLQGQDMVTATGIRPQAVRS